MPYCTPLERLALLIAAGAFAACLSGCGDSSDSRPAPGNQLPTQPVLEDPQDYLDRSLTDQVDAVERGVLDCAGLLAAYSDRIADRDEGPEGINAILSLVADPQALATEVDSTRGSGLALQCGVIVLKDNIDMAGLPTTAGSLALADNLTEEDAPVAARLREQGALLLGKANLSEWANWRGIGSTSGWSSLGGQTRNGFDGRSDPSGSSSGSAAAVAAGLVAASLGTETNASITGAASPNGVVGMKPTIGLVSRTNVIPISFTFDTPGPITRNVRDAARLLSVIAGVDQSDPATLAIPDDLDLDFEPQLEGATLDGLRLGVVEGWGLGPPDAVQPIDSLFQQELDRIAAAGATLVPVSLGFYPQLFPDQESVFNTELKVGLNEYLATHSVPGQVTSLSELIIYNRDNAEAVMPHFGQELLEAAEASVGLNDPAYREALERLPFNTGDEGILKALRESDLDALIAPTWGPAVPITYTPGGTPVPTRITLWAAWARYPHITVPMGLVNGLPVGLSVVAGPWEDATVLSVAYAYEQLQ